MYDIAVIGGGIIGLSTAFEYQKKYPSKKVILIEKEPIFATHQTGNNSGVIHSGIYYKPGSLKAVNCRNGIQKLLKFCDNNDIKYELCGKLIVATDENELPALNDLFNRGIENEIPDLKILGREEIEEIEPHVKSIQGIHSQSTGIIDYKEVCTKISFIIEKNGGEIKLNTKVIDILQSTGYNTLHTNKGEIEAKLIINCAGLFSDRIAKLTEEKIDISIIPFRGEYYTLKEESRHLVKNLIYPVPNPKFPFLGVHFTRRIDGLIEAGPNAVLAFTREGYKKTDINIRDISQIFFSSPFWKLGKQYWKVGSAEMIRSYSKKLFVISLKKLIPEIKNDDIMKGGSGVRAQAMTIDGKLLDDFKIIRGQNIIHVLNAPSPAATSAFSIAENIISTINA